MILQYTVSGCALLLTALALLGGSPALALPGSEWQPLRIGDAALPADTPLFVQFRSQGRLLGFGGCNHLHAEYRAEQPNLFIGPVAATRRSCVADVMAREAALAAALESARTYLRERTRLILFDHSAAPILELRQTDWD